MMGASGEFFSGKWISQFFNFFPKKKPATAHNEIFQLYKNPSQQSKKFVV